MDDVLRGCIFGENKKDKMASSSSSSSGIGVSGLLLVAFIVLKLTGHINWSWWWVLSPAWIPIVLVLICLAVWLLYKAWQESR